ncbi:MAG: hypothetical protein MUD14_15955 [Hydrococcus sp. Prado102]|nr:hypothetical protein [Hydrococcus sp. Prado102]
MPPIALELREQALQGISSQDRDRFSQILDRAIASIDNIVRLTRTQVNYIKLMRLVNFVRLFSAILTQSTPIVLNQYYII